MLADPPRAGNLKRPMTCAAKPIETTYLDKYNTDSTARLSLDSDRTWRANQLFPGEQLADHDLVFSNHR
jgi:hypothetical protein